MGYYGIPKGARCATRKLAAILVADAVGYSRLAGTDEGRTLAGLRGLRSDLIDPATAAHHGRIDGGIDGFDLHSNLAFYSYYEPNLLLLRPVFCLSATLQPIFHVHVTLSGRRTLLTKNLLGGYAMKLGGYAMKKTLLASATIAALTTIGGVGPASAVVLQFKAVSAAAAGFDASAGWSFTTTGAISVTALDAYDPTGDGAAGTVRLYTASKLLASAKVTKTDPKEGSPIMFYEAKLKTPILLAAGGTYFIAEDLGTATMANGNVTGLTTSAGITYKGEVAAMGQGKNPTTDATMGMFSPGIFGPNFDAAKGTAVVPEPATWAMLLLGFAGLGFVGYRQTRSAKPQAA